MACMPFKTNSITRAFILFGVIALLSLAGDSTASAVEDLTQPGCDRPPGCSRNQVVARDDGCCCPCCRRKAGRLLDAILSKDDDNGLSLEGMFTMDTSVVLSGGADPGSWANRHLLDLALTVEEAAHGIEGGRLFVHFQNFAGEDGSQDTGDLIVYSNIDNPEPVTQLAEVFIEKTWEESGLRLMLGKVDANSEFNYSDHVGDFLNSGKGNHPTTFETMPTYPDPSTALILKMESDEVWYTGFGIFDGRLVEGVPTGRRGFDFGGPYWLIGEFGLRFGESHSNRLAFGVWHHTFGRFERLDGRGTESGQTGFYLHWDATLWTEPDEPEQGWFFHANYGRSESAINSIPEALTVAIVRSGMVPARDEDSFGVAVIWAELSEHSPTLTQDAEIQIESFCRYQLTSTLVIQPAVTHIVNPGGESNSRDATVAVVRVLMSF